VVKFVVAYRDAAYRGAIPYGREHFASRPLDLLRLANVDRDDGTHPARNPLFDLCTRLGEPRGHVSGPVASRSASQRAPIVVAAIPIKSICRAVLALLLGHSAICPCTEL
jgi:hypothetical protein